jgi:hypothetical protein
MSGGAAVPLPTGVPPAGHYPTLSRLEFIERCITRDILWGRLAPLRFTRARSRGDWAATGGRGEAGHPAQDPRRSPRHHLHGAVPAAHRGPRPGGGH